MIYPPPESIHSIYLGGGTPSLLTTKQIGDILTTCRRTFEVDPAVEVTMEVNPGDVDQAYLEAVRKAGVNRLSIGMQSAHQGELRLMARDHAPDAVPQVVSSARQAGFTDLSLDLIFGLPHQTLLEWQMTLDAVLHLNPDHLSMYALELETGTALTRRVERGGLPQPDQDLVAEMYQWADTLVQQAGFLQYEISNWARPGSECRHNWQYWSYQPYLGLGAGAHGFAVGQRYEVVRDLRRYLELAGSQQERQPFPRSAAVSNSRLITPEEAMAEYVFTGLRKVREGVNLADFQARFGISLRDVYAEPLRRLISQNLVELDETRLRLTSRARLISNRVSLEFF